ncbi:TolC family protein [Azospirillum rugosum]|uniref:Outer membrane protein TolC n=1 Tax=Azospirillum rugosum TaxID=416170 RepID=A0ABS4SG51_9PROT|nr:TolC family protein [Azospirillum rugosum]MBP2291539.1 outer membrane protein TolC [Azospirillum rugosum]MDQ0525327.1 outer membrane protein TolC [Azospirillum rugosum]
MTCLPPTFRARSTMACATVALLAASLLASGCSLSPQPLTSEENLSRVRADMAVVMSPQEPIAGPVTMHEAMARAIKYNLDERVKLMEMAVANQQLDLSRFDMLPRVVAGAGYTGRNNEAGSESLNLATGRRTGESTTATDRNRRTADLGFTWNILDFGVSYLRARQNANLVLVADERRRRVVQGILQDVRTAYWRAVAAERLLKRIEPLEKRIEVARKNAGALETQRVQAPLQTLTYQRSLVDTLRQLQTLRRELVAAKSQLGALMGLPPGESFTLAIPAEATVKDAPGIATPVEALESYALLNRPELVEETYNARITADETRRALLKLLPGIDLNAGLHYDSNSFLLNQQWADYGARLSWNILNLASAWDTQSYSKAQEELVAFRRQALSVAVLSQVRVAMVQYRELAQEFALTADQAAIDQRIRQQYVNSSTVGQQGDLGVIQAEVSVLVSDLRRDLVFADLQNAYARVMVSAGVDPLPEAVPAQDMATLRRAVADGLASWEQRAGGTARLPDLLTPAATTSEKPAPAPEKATVEKAGAPVAQAPEAKAPAETISAVVTPAPVEKAPLEKAAAPETVTVASLPVTATSALPMRASYNASASASASASAQPVKVYTVPLAALAPASASRAAR